MTREEAIDCLKGLKIYLKTEHIDQEAIDMAIEALSANHTTKKPNDIVEQKNDVESFPSADAVKVAYICDGRKCDEDCSDCFRTLDIEHAKDFKLIGGVYYQQESADRPSGEWIIEEEYGDLWVCDQCGFANEHNDNYCPNCGAKMTKGGGSYYADNRLTVEWKPVSEELPQSVGSYIVTCKDEHGWVYVDYDYWTVVDEFKYNSSKVTAWIPFPKPYCGAKMGSDTR